MSTLGQRLTLLRKQSGQKTDSAPAEKSGKNLAEQLLHARAGEVRQQLVSSVIDDQSLAAKFQGEVLHPGLIVFRNEIDLHALHRNYAATLSPTIHQIASNVETARLLFVDTETTGLSTAAGTLVFLCGTGEVVGKTLLVEQVLLTRMSAESNLLGWFNQKCESKTHIVSYNGKSFDVPLLASRFRLARMKSDLLNKLHIDLLHWIRRLHQTHLPDCRLPNVEKHCLGFQRIDDMPGSEAPFVWQQLMRFGNDFRLKALLQHHALDIMSLVGLLHYAERALQNQHDSTFDTLAMARFYLRSSDTIKAKYLLENNAGKLNADGMYLLSNIYRQANEWHKAVEIWKKLQLQAYSPAIESLAKYAEHQLKDLVSASDYAKELLQLENIPENHRRLQRVQTKLNRL